MQLSVASHSLRKNNDYKRDIEHWKRDCAAVEKKNTAKCVWCRGTCIVSCGSSCGGTGMGRGFYVPFLVVSLFFLLLVVVVVIIFVLGVVVFLPVVVFAAYAAGFSSLFSRAGSKCRTCGGSKKKACTWRTCPLENYQKKMPSEPKPPRMPDPPSFRDLEKMVTEYTNSL
jgi:hypothetical protein